MSNSSSSGNDAFASAYGNPGAGLDPTSIDPNFKMRHSSVRTLGTNVGSYGQDLTAMSDRTRAIDIHTLAFGAIGGGMNVAHRTARDNAADALKQARDVLDSWKQALGTAADNAESAEEAGKAPKDPPFPKGPGSGIGGLPKGPGLGKLPKGPGVGDIDPPGMDTDVPPIDQPPPTPHPTPTPLPTPSPLPDPSPLPAPTTPGPDEIGPPPSTPPSVDDIKQPNLDTSGKGPQDLSGVDKPNTSLEGLNQANLPSTTPPPVRSPDTSAFDPRTSTPTPRPGVSYPETVMGTGTGGGSGTGSISRALNSGIPPMYPPGMGGAGGQGGDDTDRPRGPHAPEEEGVWGAEEGVSPAVIGKEED